jgi:hypothetical protein
MQLHIPTGITAIELAHGAAPHSDLHYMRALFIITNQPPPELVGAQFSIILKDFVATCLCKNPIEVCN